jgi:hypothetical protein
MHTTIFDLLFEHRLCVNKQRVSRSSGNGDVDVAMTMMTMTEGFKIPLNFVPTPPPCEVGKCPLPPPHSSCPLPLHHNTKALPCTLSRPPFNFLSLSLSLSLSAKSTCHPTDAIIVVRSLPTLSPLPLLARLVSAPSPPLLLLSPAIAS